MTEKQARYFMEVYERKNIALAAEKLFVSRPVVSRAITELEREFETRLFSRSTTGVEPTNAGVMVFRMIRDMTDSYDAVTAGIKDLENNVASRILRLGVTPTNAFKVYNVLLRGFLESFPDVHLSIIERPSAESIDLLLNGEADVIFTPREIDEPCFETFDCYHAQFSLGINAANPLASKRVLSITDVFDVTFGSLCAPLPLEDILNNCFAPFGKKPNVAVRTTSLLLLKKMVQDGQLSVVLPDDMISDWEDVAVIPLDFIRLSTHKLAWNKLGPHKSVFDDFLSYAKQIFEKSVT